ncbi:MAG: FlgD immunoglobulin-like domain containing protein [Candidatus Zixiibacteriota bacterium]
MYKKIILFIVVIGFSVSLAFAGEDCPPKPYFVDCPGDDNGRVRACILDTIFFQVKAVHPNADSARCIRYHLETGPGEVDSKTGVWSYLYEQGEDKNFEVEISASIGESGHRTEGDENCRFKVYLGATVPRIIVDGVAYTKAFLAEAPGLMTIPVEVQDSYNCGYTLEIKSVMPEPEGVTLIDPKDNLVFRALAGDADKRFIFTLKASAGEISTTAKVVIDTRTDIPAPEFRDMPDTIFVARCGHAYYNFQAFDPETNDSLGITYKLLNGPGNFSEYYGVWQYEPGLGDTGQVFEVEIAAIYAGAITSPENNARFMVDVNGNVPPVFTDDPNSPCGKEIAMSGLEKEIKVYVHDDNMCDTLKYLLADVSPQPVGNIYIDEDYGIYNAGFKVILELDEADRGKTFSITPAVTDGTDTAYCNFTVTAEIPMTVAIEKVHDQLQGQYADVDVTLNSKIDIGGFELAFAYDASALAFMGALDTTSVLFTECGWEYFDYRFGPFGSCDDDNCPSGQIKVVGIAETNNGDYHPGCFNTDSTGILFTLKFLVTNDYNYECTFVPIRFYWLDCGDNSFSNESGTELYISENVYDVADENGMDGWVNITPDDRSTIEFPTYQGAEESCVGTMNYKPIFRNINFYNGGIQILCDNMIDPEGDLNMDGLQYTLADANLFRDYFLYGIDVFGAYFEAAIEASDANYDDINLTVEDFVWLVRVLYGDVEPEPDSVAVSPDTARFVQDGGTVTLTFDSADSLGAVYLKFTGDITPVLEADSVSLGYHYDGEYTHVFIYNILNTYGIHAGALLSGVENGTLVEAVTATYFGAKVVSTVEVVRATQFEVKIETKNDVMQGLYQNIDVLMNTEVNIGGFDFIIAYNASALTFIQASTDSSEFYSNCAWEYFIYRMGPFPDCDSTCPSGLVRIVGLAETNNGDYHPSCYNIEGDNSLFSMNFLVPNDPALECFFVPIRFYWVDCGDNILSDETGYELYISNNVFDKDEDDWIQVNPDDGSTVIFPTYQGANDTCLNSPPVFGGIYRAVDFYNGGVNLLCKDTIYDRGDLNLDGLAYTIADWVMYITYFVYGTEVFEPYIEEATANSDINGDGIPLTVEDLMLLNRRLAGDIGMFDTVAASPDTARFAQNSGVVTVNFNSPDSLGAVYLKFSGEVSPVLEDDELHFISNYEDGFTRVFIGPSHLGGKGIHSGPLVTGVGDGVLVEVATAAYSSAKVVSFIDVMMDTDNDANNLPDNYSLSANYPNPFNPSTTIEFNLPSAGNVELVVYNIRGQVVRTLVDGQMSAGNHTVTWNSTNDVGEQVASGVYLYRLRADSFTAVKKMILMK